MSEREQLEQTIAALEAQRAILGDGVVDTALSPLRAKLAMIAEPQPAVAEQRKQATVLFADVSGFTAMAETMDAEDVIEAMNTFWHRLDTIIIDHGGWIDKHMGDAVMALWGVHTAREDDPEQAIRAALAMQSELATHPSDEGAAFRLRIGINTGLVVLGALGATGEFTAIGDAVNLASRLEQAAPPGGVLISHQSYRHVRGLFEVQPLDPFPVKGKTELVQAYLVKEARPRRFYLGTRGVEGIETRMIGREAELLRLQSAWQATIAGGRLQAITVVGEAGVGKSRLLYEFRVWLELQPSARWLFTGRATQEMLSLPYALLRDLFAARFGRRENDPPPLAREKFEQGLRQLWGRADPEGAMKTHLIGQLLGLDFSQSPFVRGILDDARQIRNLALHYLAQLFATMARERPLLLILEDLHWADTASLDAIRYLLDHCQDTPFFSLSFTRPRLFERDISWKVDQPGHTRLLLQPLSPQESNQLLQEILRKVPEIPDTLRALVSEGAEGNPFYVEELIKMLIEERVIVPGADVWDIQPERLALLTVPPTLVGVLQARLDGLPVEERSLLQRAAIVGRIFWDQAVESLGVALPDQAAPTGALLGALRRRELIYRRDPSAFAAAQEYSFKHALLREVTHEGILKRERGLYHKQAAEWIIGQAGERGDLYAALIADHYAQAGESTLAAEWYLRAGRHAQAAYANATAIEAYEKALPLLAAPERGTVLLALGNVLELIGRWEEAERHYREALLLATQPPDPALATRSQYAMGMLLRKRGEWAQAMSWLERARLGYEAADDQAGRSQTLIAMGYVGWNQHDLPAAQRYAEEGLALARSIGDTVGSALALHVLGTILNHRSVPDYGAARAAYEESLALRRALGDKEGIASTLNNLGVLASDEGDDLTAEARWRESLELSLEIGDKRGMAFALHNLGEVAERQSHAAARLRYEEALLLFRDLGDTRGICFSLEVLARLTYEQGAYEAGHAYGTEWLELARAIKDPRNTAGALARLALITLAEGDDRRARALAEESRAIRREHESTRGTVFTLYVLASVTFLQREYAAARASYEESLVLARELDIRESITLSLKGLGAVALAESDIPEAQARYRESLDHWCALQDRHQMGHCLLGIARVLATTDARRATVLMAAAQALLDATGSTWEPIEREMVEHTLIDCRARLDEASFAEAWQTGRTYLLGQGVQALLAHVDGSD